MARILIGRTLDSSTDSVTTNEANKLVPEEYDYIELGYTGTVLSTVTYKTGGSGGTTVALVTLTYDSNGNLETVTRT